MREEWTLKRLLTDVMGSGPKSASDMTREQATQGFERVLSGESDPTTLGAFLLANRWKTSAPVELAAFVDAMRERSVRTASPEASPVDCGANYDGKSETALLGVAAGLVAAAAGTPVVAHSADRVPAKGGCAYKHVLDELGVPTDLTPEASAAMVDEVGFGFYYQPRFNPDVHALLDRRDAMGVRTSVNTVETLADPANAGVHLGSFYHLSYATRIIDTVRESGLPVSRVVMFQGLEGYDDVRPGYTKVAEWTEGDDEISDFEIETAELGMDLERDDLAVADLPADSARVTEEVLAGERTDGFADAVALNAALRLYARTDVETVEAGVERARDVIAEGSAADALADLRQFDPASVNDGR
ncbi:anthranilate phosphoribosyltransferase [Haloplanus sp. GCM10025708]|uniref:anthranilate phosphoribosyltransferase n=1 Tax=Haloferacaceae TaxID=1644056 RepID=UPI003608D4C0